MLSTVFVLDEDIEILVRRFLKKLKGCVAMCFKKVRINKLFSKMRKLKGKEDTERMDEMEKVILEIAEIDEKEYNEIIEKLDTVSDNNVNTQAFWKVEKKMCPKAKEPPVAMLDEPGNLLTIETAIQERAIEAFTERLKLNEIQTNIKRMEETTNKLCEIRLEKTKKNKSETWNIDNLEAVLKDRRRPKTSNSKDDEYDETTVKIHNSI